jgi:hypothetical protein
MSTAYFRRDVDDYSRLRCMSANQPLAVFPGHLPLTTANIVRVYDAIEEEGHIKPHQLFVVPYVIKILADATEGIDFLKRFKVVSFGGSSLPDGEFPGRL